MTDRTTYDHTTRHSEVIYDSTGDVQVDTGSREHRA